MRNPCIRQFESLIAVTIALIATPGSLFALELVSVEEHWELRLGEPDDNLSAPQVTMTMSPTPDLDGRFFVFTLNHLSEPEYLPGGMQVQSWNGDEVENSSEGPNEAALHHTDETIRWVQRLSHNGGQLTFEIDGGQSQTWGNFGGQGYLKLQVATSLLNLNGYLPSVNAISLAESGVNFAGNRVSTLTLTKVVYTLSDGQVIPVESPYVLETGLDP